MLRLQRLLCLTTALHRVGYSLTLLGCQVLFNVLYLRWRTRWYLSSAMSRHARNGAIRGGVAYPGCSRRVGHHCNVRFCSTGLVLGCGYKHEYDYFEVSGNRKAQLKCYCKSQFCMPLRFFPGSSYTICIFIWLRKLLVYRLVH